MIRVTRQVEEYVRAHSDAEFSQSICAGCMSKLYPDYADDVLKDMNDK